MRSIIVAILVAAALLLGSAFYTVSEIERAVVLRFGKVVETDVAPGWHFKRPFIDNVRKFDGRLLTTIAESERYLTLEKKAVIVDSFAKWRIKDVAKFYTATSGDLNSASRLLSQRINAGLRNQVAIRTMHEVVSGERDQLMSELTTTLNKVANEELGVEVIDVRVKQIDLPEEVSGSVFERMNAEREREAREYRSEGKEIAEGIRANADKEKTIIESEAYRDAERIRGEGDAKSAAIYAKAYNKNREFYDFSRSLKAYQQAFNNGNDVMVLAPDSDFFRYLNKKGSK